MIADVCLLLEGTYPYVSGGVSSWVAQIMRAMPDVTFSVVYLGANDSVSKRPQYDHPPNLIACDEVYLFDLAYARPQVRRADTQLFARVERFLTSMKDGGIPAFEALVNEIDRRRISVDAPDLLFSYEAWKVVETMYAQAKTDVSFIDFFWTWRFVHMPFFSLLAFDLPPARMYHSVSTGYAGLLGALARMRTGRPFLLTEHGIYTRERRIDIAQADWIYSEAKDTPVVTHRTNEFFKEWWMTLFSFLSRLAYERADEIVSLYEGNRRQQVIEGAPAHKTRVISNGIVFDPHAVSSRHAPRGKNIGLMGRVVPIKDIKTFIDICRELIRTDDEYRFFVMGPLDEDPAYFDECREIVALCGLDDRLTFTGKVRADEWYPKLDLLVLTSISEGQPLVILEGYAHGLPCAATDVGACREMICGSTRDDRLLGASGEIIPLREPTESARIIHALMSDHERYARCSHAATERLRAYYHADEMFAAYRKRYAFLTEVC